MSARLGLGLGLGLGLAIAVGAGCGASMHPRRLTGTCGGACDYYLACKHEHEPDPDARVRCVRECRDMFSDEQSLRELESLPCQDMIEFVDGTQTTALNR